jgi:hypothetical protein
MTKFDQLQTVKQTVIFSTPRIETDTVLRALGGAGWGWRLQRHLSFQIRFNNFQDYREREGETGHRCTAVSAVCLIVIVVNGGEGRGAEDAEAL